MSPLYGRWTKNSLFLPCYKNCRKTFCSKVNFHLTLAAIICSQYNAAPNDDWFSSTAWRSIFRRIGIVAFVLAMDIAIGVVVPWLLPISGGRMKNGLTVILGAQRTVIETSFDALIMSLDHWVDMGAFAEDGTGHSHELRMVRNKSDDQEAQSFRLETKTGELVTAKIPVPRQFFDEARVEALENLNRIKESAHSDVLHGTLMRLDRQREFETTKERIRARHRELKKDTRDSIEDVEVERETELDRETVTYGIYGFRTKLWFCGCILLKSACRGRTTTRAMGWLSWEHHHQSNGLGAPPPEHGRCCDRGGGRGQPASYQSRRRVRGWGVVLVGLGSPLDSNLYLGGEY